MEISEKVTTYYAQPHHFKEGIEILRNLALKSAAQEAYKWSVPVYTIAGKNVFWISRFKNHFGLGFFNGIFLKDEKKVLVNAQEGKTQAMRHWKFTSSDEIDKKKVLAYMNEAIENQRKGMCLLPEKKKNLPVSIPQLLEEALSEDKNLNRAFKALSPYHQKEYSEYIITAKQEKTKLARLEKILPIIREGKGLNDKYKKV